MVDDVTGTLTVPLSSATHTMVGVGRAMLTRMLKATIHMIGNPTLAQLPYPEKVRI